MDNDKKNETPELAKIIERNIEALLQRRKQEDDNKTNEERIADGITRFTGSLTFIYIHLIVFGIWVLWNLGFLGINPFDPTFVILAICASTETIFLSTFVLITQKRMSILADKRADLDLHISLLTEHEVTRLITLVILIAKKMDIADASHPEIDELSKNVQPEKVMDTIEKQTEEHKSAL